MRTGVRVLAIESRGAAHVVRSDAGELDAGAVVVATPAFVAAGLVAAAAPALRAIPYVSTSVVLLVYPDKYFDVVGFGLVAIVLMTQWLRKPSIQTS